MEDFKDDNLPFYREDNAIYIAFLKSFQSKHMFCS